MCGICGIREFRKNKSVEKKSLTLMTEAIIHRGPDEEGYFLDEHFGFASRRLSIIDLKSGHQPIISENKRFSIVFNGEIYNYRSLKEKLIAKHKFKTNSDTEVILHLYEDVKEKTPSYLEGMFSFAIWDSEKQELFIARDRMGEKPLYWSKSDNYFLFASEVKSLFSSGLIKPTLNRAALPEYLFYGYIPAPMSIFENIHKLPPGYYLKLSAKGEIIQKQYWDLDYKKKIKLSFKEIILQSEKLLTEAVEKCLVADVDIGIWLSGGIDSSLISAIAQKKYSPRKIKAYSIGFGERESDESENAKEIANFLRCKHFLKILKKENLLSTLLKTVEIFDEPLSDPSIIPTYFLSEFSSNENKVMLSGDGGDESFGGYPKYLAMSRLNQLESLSFLEKVIHEEKIKTFFKYKDKKQYEKNYYWIAHFSESEIKSLCGISFKPTVIEKYHQEFSGNNLIDESFYLDQKIVLPNDFLYKVDMCSMANSLEVRCPFLDKNLIEFASSLNYKDKLGLLTPKKILRTLARKYLPDKITKLKKKGFGIPLDSWIKSQNKGFIFEILENSELVKDNILSKNSFLPILNNFEPKKIWQLLILELWYRRWIKNQNI